MKKYTDIALIVLAAGEGKRMKSSLPKVLHTIAGKPLVRYILETGREIDFGQTITVVRYKAAKVVSVVKEYSQPVMQGELYGTAKAVEAAIGSLNDTIVDIIVVNGDDSMFYSPKTLKRLVKLHQMQRNAITFITVKKENPLGLGRVVYTKEGKLAGIVEEKDATVKQKLIKEINTGTYLFSRKFLQETIASIEASPVTQEYYLTELIALALKQTLPVGTLKLGKTSEFISVNTPDELVYADSVMRKKETDYVTRAPDLASDRATIAS